MNGIYTYIYSRFVPSSGVRGPIIPDRILISPTRNGACAAAAAAAALGKTRPENEFIERGENRACVYVYNFVMDLFMIIGELKARINFVKIHEYNMGKMFVI